MRPPSDPQAYPVATGTRVWPRRRAKRSFSAQSSVRPDRQEPPVVGCIHRGWRSVSKYKSGPVSRRTAIRPAVSRRPGIAGAKRRDDVGVLCTGISLGGRCREGAGLEGIGGGPGAGRLLGRAPWGPREADTPQASVEVAGDEGRGAGGEDRGRGVDRRAWSGSAGVYSYLPSSWGRWPAGCCRQRRYWMKIPLEARPVAGELPADENASAALVRPLSMASSPMGLSRRRQP